MGSRNLASQRLPTRPLALLLLLMGFLLASGTALAQGSTFALRNTYARPEILTDVAWLAAHLDDPTVRIIDARVPYEKALYPTAHIPGAVFVDAFAALPFMPPQAFATAVGRLGIDNDTTVVIYDTDGGAWGARLWWALKLHGHDRAMMLNAGLRQWLMAGFKLEQTTPTVTPATFTPATDLRWLATEDDVRAAIDDPDVVLLDTNPLYMYRGDLAMFERPGHIPTALSFPTPDTIEGGVSMMVRPPATLSRMLARLDLDPAERTVTYCGSGFYGAHAAFVLYLMGFDDVAVYVGSLMEWTSNPINPMTTEP